MPVRYSTARLALALVFVIVLSLVFSLLVNVAVSVDGTYKPDEIPELNCISKTASMSTPPEPAASGSYRASFIISADNTDKTQRADLFFCSGFCEYINGNGGCGAVAKFLSGIPGGRILTCKTVMLC